MINLLDILKEMNSLLEGDRGQVLLSKAKKPRSETRGPRLNDPVDPTGVIKKGEAQGKKLLKVRKGKKVTESRGEAGMGSKAGRDSIQNYKHKSHSNPMKSRVRNYNSITDALKRGYTGQIFSTKNADRLYVITKQKWGKDKEQIVNGRSAKGFSAGSIPSKFSDVKKYAHRTMKRHGGASRKEKD